jgi:hypothetical protein
MLKVVIRILNRMCGWVKWGIVFVGGWVKRVNVMKMKIGDAVCFVTSLIIIQETKPKWFRNECEN